MPKIQDIELQSSSEYSTGLYIADDYKHYDIVFCRNSDRNNGWESIELCSVQHDEDSIDDPDLWQEVNQCLSQTLDSIKEKALTIQFRIELDKSALPLLEDLTKLVLSDPLSTPEAALESSIFQQIRTQAQEARPY